jgi:hypothetical protein
MAVKEEIHRNARIKEVNVGLMLYSRYQNEADGQDFLKPYVSI